MEDPPASPQPGSLRSHLLQRTVAKALAGSVAMTLSALATMAILLTAAEPNGQGKPHTIQQSSSPSGPVALADLPHPITAGLQPVNYHLNGQAASRVDEIPAAAWVGYQRAEVIINAAAPSCRITAELLAAIGETISDHGQRPNPQPGELLGPLAIPPATWAVVAVDADNDGIRDPTDLGDATLATAVLLCDQHTDLAQAGDLVTALERLNQHPTFVPAVLAAYSRLLAGPREFRRPTILRIRQQPHGAPQGEPTTEATKAVARLLDPHGMTVTRSPRPDPTTKHTAPAPTRTPTCVPATSTAGTPWASTDPSDTTSPTSTSTGRPSPSSTPTEEASPTDGVSPTDEATGSAQPEAPCTDTSDGGENSTGSVPSDSPPTTDASNQEDR